MRDEYKYEKYPLTMAECLQYAQEHRPEIAQYNAEVASAEYDVKIAQSGYVPTVNLTAEEDWYDRHLAGTKTTTGC